eukprot:201137_1
MDKIDIKDEVDSDYLLQPFNLHQLNKLKCKLRECVSLVRIINTLKQYNLYIEQEQPAKLFSDDHKSSELLNDFNHLLLEHGNCDEFEYIYNRLVSNNEAICSLAKCLVIKRNNRNRSATNNGKLKQLYFVTTNDDVSADIIQQQIVDRVHCHYLHSFDVGYKMSQTDRKLFCEELKTDEIDNVMPDSNLRVFNEYINRKRRVLERTKTRNNKFMVITEEKKSENYSMGYRYYYWDHYKNNCNIYDDTFAIGSWMTQPTNDQTTLGDWYIYNKYDTFQTETLQNEIYVTNRFEWNLLLQKAKYHLLTDHVRETYVCPRKDTAKNYGMKYNDKIKGKHLIALMVYCNFETLQFKFTETYRLINEDKQNVKNMKDRHRNYFFLGKLLRECVECFGMNRKVDYNDTISLFYGVNKNFAFSSIFAFIKGPLSTTTDCCVAGNFCQNAGMILNMNIKTAQWVFSYNDGYKAFTKISCFDCQWISDYSNEQEVLFIGGLNKIAINSIIDVSTGINYGSYLKGLKQMTYCMTHGDWVENNIAITTIEKKFVVGLMCHHLSKCCPKHKHARTFNNFPKYIQNIMQRHCGNIRDITFLNRDNESKLHEYLFKYDNGWIKLDLLLSLFPNLQVVEYHAEQISLSFLTQPDIYVSILSFVEKYKPKQLECIAILINPNYCTQIENYINFYKKKFNEHLWDIKLHTVDNIYAQSIVTDVKKVSCIRIESLTATKLKHNIKIEYLLPQMLPKIIRDYLHL